MRITTGRTIWLALGLFGWFAACASSGGEALGTPAHMAPTSETVAGSSPPRWPPGLPATARPAASAPRVAFPTGAAPGEPAGPALVPPAEGWHRWQELGLGEVKAVEEVGLGWGYPIVDRYQPTTLLLTAATVPDHDRREQYLRYLSRHPSESSRLALDMTRRVRFRVLDQDGVPIGDAGIRLEVAGVIIVGRTHADGVWDLFPGVYGDHVAGPARAVVEAEQATAEVLVQIPPFGDGQDVIVRLPGGTGVFPALDLCFAIDVTGSMEDELRYVNVEVGDIVRRIRAAAPETTVRVGAALYRDRRDVERLLQIPFTEDVEGFARLLSTVAASGGGDYPEDLNAGLELALTELTWTGEPAVRVLVLIADAPPQPYASQFTYREAMHTASYQGIRILPVAASGADEAVEFLFRAMGAFTSTPYLYLTDDSGIGNPHLPADTDRVTVEYFNDLLTRLIIEDLLGEGMHEPDYQGDAVSAYGW